MSRLYQHACVIVAGIIAIPAVAVYESWRLLKQWPSFVRAGVVSEFRAAIKMWRSIK